VALSAPEAPPYRFDAYLQLMARRKPGFRGGPRTSLGTVSIEPVRREKPRTSKRGPPARVGAPRRAQTSRPQLRRKRSHRATGDLVDGAACGFPGDAVGLEPCDLGSKAGCVRRASAAPLSMAADAFGNASRARTEGVHDAFEILGRPGPEPDGRSNGQSQRRRAAAAGLDRRTRRERRPAPSLST
jgi:hypothetical protein